MIFLFLADLSDILTICLSHNFGAKIGEGSANDYIAQKIREINREKDQRIKDLQSQLNQEQTNNQDSQRKNSQLTSQLQQKNQELENLSQENQQLSDLLSSNQPYNFTELKAEITRLKIQELTPQVRSKGTELKQLITNVKTKGGNYSEKMVDLLLEN